MNTGVLNAMRQKAAAEGATGAKRMKIAAEPIAIPPSKMAAIPQEAGLGVINVTF